MRNLKDLEFSKMPLAAVCEGHVVMLSGDEVVDSDRSVEQLQEPLVVIEGYSGLPRNSDLLRVGLIVGDWSEVASDDAKEFAFTLLLTSGEPRFNGVLAFFPNDQHEVSVGHVDDEEESEED